MGFLKFLNEFELEGEQITGKPLWNGKDYLDQSGHIDLFNKKLTELPCTFPEKWDKGFYCSGNELTSLEGAPKEVGGDFSCSNNKLTSLIGAPKEVGGNFYCLSNELTSLKGIPVKIGGDIVLGYNPIKFTSNDVLKAGCKELKGRVR